MKNPIKKKPRLPTSELGVVVLIVIILVLYASRQLIFATVVAIRTGDSEIFTQVIEQGDATITSIVVVGLLNLASGFVGFKLKEKTSDKE